MSDLALQNLPGLIGHELRNPLASAMTGAMVARDMVDAQDPRAAVLDGVLRDLDRMTGLIDGWLELAQNREATVSQVSAVELFEHATRCSGVERVGDVPDVHVTGNRCLLERSIENLCENARKASATSIRLRAEVVDSSLEIHVDDDGEGVDPADVDRVFDAGWSGFGGTGLGLQAVRATAAAIGGRVTCTPRPVGTRFTLSFPCAAPVSA